MDISDIIVTNNSVKIKVTVNPSSRDHISPNFKFSFIEYRLKVTNINSYGYWCLQIQTKKCVDEDILCTFKVISSELELEKTVISDDSVWRVLGSYVKADAIYFQIEVNVGTNTHPLVRHLVNDFFPVLNLKGIDGSIPMDGTVLAAASEVFQRMFTNDFKEKKEAQVELPYSVCVLQDLKDYLYLNKFNNDNLVNLFMLADCYMMHDLRHICLTKMFSLSLKKMKEIKDSDIKEEAQIKE